MVFVKGPGFNVLDGSVDQLWLKMCSTRFYTGKVEKTGESAEDWGEFKDVKVAKVQKDNLSEGESCARTREVNEEYSANWHLHEDCYHYMIIMPLVSVPEQGIHSSEVMLERRLGSSPL
ncbi:hypothetical protein Q8A73_004111 [Channa argus]|nr:hypothetical protein Q8A73_004111 [Channa argus]